MTKFCIMNQAGEGAIDDEANLLFKGELNSIHTCSRDDKMPRVAWVMVHYDGEVSIAVAGRVTIKVDKDGDGWFEKIVEGE